MTKRSQLKKAAALTAVILVMLVILVAALTTRPELEDKARTLGAWAGKTAQTREAEERLIYSKVRACRLMAIADIAPGVDPRDVRDAYFDAYMSNRTSRIVDSLHRVYWRQTGNCSKVSEWVDENDLREIVSDHSYGPWQSGWVPLLMR